MLKLSKFIYLILIFLSLSSFKLKDPKNVYFVVNNNEVVIGKSYLKEDRNHKIKIFDTSAYRIISPDSIEPIENSNGWIYHLAKNEVHIY